MNLNTRKIFIISIIVACVIAIILGVYFEVAKNFNKETQEEDNVIIDVGMLTQNFDNIFDNQIDYQGNTIDIQKEDYTKEIVYTSYTNEETIENKYKLNVNIPCININTDTVKEINNEISSLFYNRAKNIIDKSDSTIYDVKYKAYVNDNILSLIISGTLEEGKSDKQRTIMKTYNYNLSSDSKLSINEILQYRKISVEYAQNRVNETIKASNKIENKYIRNINNSMYKLENTIVYFLGENKAIYIIYPYGNLSYTSETDLLVI